MGAPPPSSGNPPYFTLTPPTQISRKVLGAACHCDWLSLNTARPDQWLVSVVTHSGPCVCLCMCLWSLLRLVVLIYTSLTLTTLLRIGYPVNPNIGSSSAASVCLGVCLRVSGWVCEQECVFSLSQSVRAKDEVSAISDRGEYVFLSTARRMEKSGSNDYPWNES